MFEEVSAFLSSYHFLGNDLWQWTLSLLIILGGYVSVKILYFLFNRLLKKLVKKTKTKTDDIIVETTEKPVMLAVMLVSFWWAIHRLDVSPQMLKVVDYAYQFLIIINVCWVITRISEGLIKEYSRKSEKSIDYRIRIIIRTIKWVVWIIGVLTALNNMGVNVGAVITGLGIGGVAVAFAAQDTIKNLFAGFVIFFDKPFKIGDRIVVGTYDGTVEDIGLRSVRVRLLNQQLVTLSTASVVDTAVVNVTAEPAKRITVTLGLTYDTTPEKMQLALQLLKDTPKSVAQIEAKSFPYFVEYGDSSLNLKYLYDIKPGEDFFETQSKVNLHILTEFNKNGLDFAFPTQTVYVKN
jgi:MscS family membrane protein